ncbi:hypothetical protein JXR93_05875 [bacterium]|nr:hypothetical protein [bacterium]
MQKTLKKSIFLLLIYLSSQFLILHHATHTSHVWNPITAKFYDVEKKGSKYISSLKKINNKNFFSSESKRDNILSTDCNDFLHTHDCQQLTFFNQKVEIPVKPLSFLILKTYNTYSIKKHVALYFKQNFQLAYIFAPKNSPPKI